MLSAILGAILLIGSGEKVLAEGSMFDSPYVVPYTGIDDDGTERNYFAIRQHQPVDTTRDSGYRYHS